MRHYKSERLKKLEEEHNDLQQWLKLGLVPKKDIEKHKEEIEAIKSKIEEEKDRLQFLKESGETEEYVAPKRSQAKGGYTEMPSIPDIEVAETASGVTEIGYDTESGADETTEHTATVERSTEQEDEEINPEDEEEESYFSDRNRWRRGGRGGIRDPDADEW